MYYFFLNAFLLTNLWPSINDVNHFWRFLTPPSPCHPLYLIGLWSNVKFCQIPSPPKMGDIIYWWSLRIFKICLIHSLEHQGARVYTYKQWVGKFQSAHTWILPHKHVRFEKICIFSNVHTYLFEFLMLIFWRLSKFVFLDVDLILTKYYADICILKCPEGHNNF